VQGTLKFIMESRTGELIQPSIRRWRNFWLATFILSTNEDKPSLFKLGYNHEVDGRYLKSMLHILGI